MNWSALSGWLVTRPVAVVAILICTLGLYLGLVLLTRIAGLRSFSKLSGFDFPVTVAFRPRRVDPRTRHSSRR